MSDCIETDTPGEHSSIFGVAFDGFAIYGPQDTNGELPVDLDECNGHIGPTLLQLEDVYHYHMTAEPPYVLGCYRGTVDPVFLQQAPPPAEGGGETGGGETDGGETDGGGQPPPPPPPGGGGQPPP